MDRRELYSLTGSIVRISRAGVPGVHQFSVESAADGKAVLRPCERAGKDLASGLRQGDRLHLTAGTHDGVLRGELTVDRWQVAQRMLIVDNPPLVFMQQRESFRVPIGLPVELVGLTHDATAAPAVAVPATVSGTTIDVSDGGFSAVFRDPVLGTGPTAVVLRLPDTAIVCVADVREIVHDRRAAVRARFVQMIPAHASALSAELRRAEVARVRTARSR